MKRTNTGLGLIIAGAIAIAGLPSAAIAQTATAAESASLTKKVDALLAESGTTQKQWQALGKKAVGPLVAALEDRGQSEARRGRAAIGLSFLNTGKSKTALRGALDDQSTPSHVRTKVIVAVARAEGAGGAGLIAHELTHVSQGVREAAIKALGDIGTEGAHKALRIHLEAETAASLKSLINQQLSRSKK